MSVKQRWSVPIWAIHLELECRRADLVLAITLALNASLVYVSRLTWLSSTLENNKLDTLGKLAYKRIQLSSRKPQPMRQFSLLASFSMKISNKRCALLLLISNDSATERHWWVDLHKISKIKLRTSANYKVAQNGEPMCPMFNRSDLHQTKQSIGSLIQNIDNRHNIKHTVN